MNIAREISKPQKNLVYCTVRVCLLTVTFSIKLEAEGCIYRQRKGRDGINMENKMNPNVKRQKGTN